jgi:alkanesulfonate monooxygenase SsuD/methylene tetrahydromethanopterin reductase-like flavin-dependent oxidoreductase (luciferase family)
MKLGIAIFPADFAIRPDELARAVEERGFESLFFTDHTHIPATPQTRKRMEEARG